MKRNYPNLRILSLPAFLVALGVISLSVSADTIFESATLGPTGVTWQQGLDGDVPVASINQNIFTGVRFELKQPVITTQIGGHFVAPTSGDFFGAIVKLVDENDLPDSIDLSTPDVLGSTLLTFPVPSDEVYGDLALSLDPGWYALAFGSGVLGAVGHGGAVGDGLDVGNPSYIGYQFGSGWLDIGSLPFNFEGFRNVVRGEVVPEPSSLGMTLLFPFLFFLSRNQLRAID